jgi:transcriptional regulator GlxA family with amidase domain
LRGRGGRLLNLDDSELGVVESLQGKIRAEQLERSSAGPTMCLLRLAEILIYISRLLEDKSGRWRSLEVYGPLAAAHAYMHRKLRDRISVEELAAIAKMSKRNFQRLFMKSYRLSPMEYLMKIRLEKSRELLKSSDRDVAEVAAESGFQANSYFSMQFKKAFGISPKRYRSIVCKRAAGR